MILVLLIILISVAAGFMALRKISGLRARQGKPHSPERYYAYYVGLMALTPALIVLTLWNGFEQSWIEEQVIRQLPFDLQSQSSNRIDLLLNDVRNTLSGHFNSTPSAPTQAAVDHYQTAQHQSQSAKTLTVILTALLVAGIGYGQVNIQLRARNRVENWVKVFMIGCALVAVLTTLGIVLSVVFESIRFFQKVPLTDFLFGLNWSPQTAMRTDQVGASGAFGMIPLLAGTLLISSIAMAVAVPIGLLAAIYLSEFSGAKVRAAAKPALEILAGIPTVVYGFFAALTVAPALRGFGADIGLDVASESALSAGLVMGIMIIPFVSSLSDDVMNAVPQSLRDAAYALGATQAETVRHIVVPAALPGIVGSILLAVSRAIGETMIVVMAAGLAAKLTFNPLDAVTTVTVQIVTLLVGDQAFDSPKTLAAFALGMVLFLMTLALNAWALSIVRKYRERYE
ncbi:MAG: phosphate ABC transporter permease subunit PstC [Methylococcales bacterium]|nr:phosphate ABC transporter permease subunit PstC [Methylococcales bacterium]